MKEGGDCGWDEGWGRNWMLRLGNGIGTWHDALFWPPHPHLFSLSTPSCSPFRETNPYRVGTRKEVTL